MITIIFILTLLSFFVYSFVLIDPNLTLISHPLWAVIREPLVQFGYHNREQSWLVYLFFVIVLFVLHFYILKNHKEFNSIKLALIVGLLLLLSYPFLSHDFFNYMFDARILTYYGENPYTKTALDFPEDEWLRFMHWVHRPYPYGPSFLLLTLIPSFFSLGKLILNYLLFKLLYVAIYILGVFYLNKLNKKSALEFATHPFIIIEGIINVHNDFIGVVLGIVGAYYLFKDKQIQGRILMLLSGAIKYISLPLVFMTPAKNVRWNVLVFTGQLLLLGYLIFTRGFQQWYFLILFAYVPYFPNIIKYTNILLFGLLISYYPYIRLGGWDKPEEVLLKDQIIYVFLFINLLILIGLKVTNKLQFPILKSAKK